LKSENGGGGPDKQPRPAGTSFRTDDIDRENFFQVRKKRSQYCNFTGAPKEKFASWEDNEPTGDQLEIDAEGGG